MDSRAVVDVGRYDVAWIVGSAVVAPPLPRSTPTLINGVEDTPVADPELPRRA